MGNIRVAAIQMQAKVGAVASNLSHAESMAREAFRGGAEWVILPEFFTSAAAFTPSMLSAWLPLEGPALELLRKLAREHDGVGGGSFIAKSGKDCFNSFLLVFPNGQYYRHDKDLPTMWENSYYIGGSDDGVLATPAGPVGVALCWELIRSQTVRRLVGKVNFVVGGSCWWDLRLPVPPEYADDQARLRNLLRQAPGDLARRLGVPVVHAAQVGEFEGLTPGNETVPYVSRYLGEAQITDGHGNVLARLAYEDGEGVVTADIAPGRVEGGLAPTPEGFWTAELPSNTLQRWDHLNSLGRDYYAPGRRRDLFDLGDTHHGQTSRDLGVVAGTDLNFGKLHGPPRLRLGGELAPVLLHEAGFLLELDIAQAAVDADGRAALVAAHQRGGDFGHARQSNAGAGLQAFQVGPHGPPRALDDGELELLAVADVEDQPAVPGQQAGLLERLRPAAAGPRQHVIEEPVQLLLELPFA